MKKRRFDEGGDVDDSLLSNKDNASSVSDDTRARAMKFLESGKKDEETKTTPKSAPKSISKSSSKAEIKKETKEEPKVGGKTFSETIAPSRSKNQDTPKEDKKTPAEIAKIQREAIAGPDKNLPAPEPKSWGKRLRESLGSQYKSGGKVAGKLATRGYGKAR